MRLDSMIGKTFRLKVCALVGASSLFAVTAGCDPQVQNALVQGLGNAAVAALEAMFTRDTTQIQPGVGPVPTVMLDTASDTVWA